MQITSTFFSSYTPVSFNKGESLINEGVNPPGIFYINRGFVRQFLYTESGQEITLNFLKPGAFFPMFWAINNQQNKHFFQAFTNLETFLAPKSDVVEFLKKNPDVLFDLTNRLLFGIDGLLLRIESLSSFDAKSSIKSILLFLAKHFGIKKGETIQLTEHFTHQEIANLTGLTRETTSRELEKLKKEKIIEVNSKHQIIIRNPEALSQ